MTKSIEPELPAVSTVEPNVQFFRASVLGTAGLAVVCGLSWHQRGIWPLIEGLLVSVSLLCSGAALLLTVRARALAAPSTVRPWMRPVAAAVILSAVAIAGSTLWRWPA